LTQFPRSILSGGLKIMPHAGGRVGRGLYFADMISKSEQYLGLHGDIVRDNCNLINVSVTKYSSLCRVSSC
jgi:hypothetical protein